MKRDWTEILVYITFATFLVLLLWFIFGKSPTFEQLLVGVLGIYGSLFLQMNKRLSDLEVRLHDKLTELERRLGDKIDKVAG